VVIDLEAFWNNKPLKDLNAQDVLIQVGSGNFYPEIESGLLGLKKGSNRDITIAFKEDFHDIRLAGKDVVFSINIKDIKEKELPKLNNQFAKGLGGDIKSVAGLKKKVKEDLFAQEARRVDAELKKRLLKKITDSVDFELPQVAVEGEIERSLAALKQNLMLRGTRFEATGLSEEKMREDLRKGAEQKVKEDLVLGKIADLENIDLDEATIREGFKNLAAQTGRDMAQLRRYYEENHLMDSFRNQLLVEKILNHCVHGANITEVERISEKGHEERKEA
jgi:trigger factor